MATELLEAPAEPEAPAPAPRRRLDPRLVIGAVALVVAGWGVKTYLHSRHYVTTDNAEVDGHLTPIAPKVQAFVSRVLVDDNRRVRAGDTLVVLDNRDLQVKLEQATAELASARAAAGGRVAGQAEAQYESSRAAAAGAGAAVAAAQAEWQKAAADLGRYRGLAASKVISAQQLDAAEAAAAAAQANLEAAQRQAAAATSNVAASAAAIRSADARLAYALQAVDNAKLQLSYTVIAAPLDGVVARRSVEPGALVQVGQTLMTVVPLRDVWVTANLKETQLENVRPGQPVTFSVDAYPGTTFTGRVEGIAPATGARFALLPPDNATGNFTKVVQRVPVRIAVDSPDTPAHPLRPGMSVEVSIKVR